MLKEQTETEMAEPMKLVKISVKNFNKLKKYGFASESLNRALDRVLVTASAHEQEIRDQMDKLEAKEKK